MIEFSYTITVRGGIHARPASSLYAKIRTLSSTVMILKNQTKINARRLTDIMELNIRQNDVISFQLDGEYARRDQEVLLAYCKENL